MTDLDPFTTSSPIEDINVVKGNAVQVSYPSPDIQPQAERGVVQGQSEPGAGGAQPPDHPGFEPRPARRSAGRRWCQVQSYISQYPDRCI